MPNIGARNEGNASTGPIASSRCVQDRSAAKNMVLAGLYVSRLENRFPVVMSFARYLSCNRLFTWRPALTLLSVRQYLNLHGIKATRADCIHLSKCARAYSEIRGWTVEIKHTSASDCRYDVRALRAVCREFKHSETERQCTRCLKMKPQGAFYNKKRAQCKVCYRRLVARRAQTFEGRERVQQQNARAYRLRKLKQLARVMEVSGAANR